MTIDRQRVEAVRILTELGYGWGGARWSPPDDAVLTRAKRIEAWAAKAWRVGYDFAYQETPEEERWVIQEGTELFGPIKHMWDD